MKYLKLSALALAIIAVGCETKQTDQSDKIAELEQKLARLEAAQPVPTNVSSVEAADPSSLGAFQFQEMEYDFGTIDEGKVVEHLFKFTRRL